MTPVWGRPPVGACCRAGHGLRVRFRLRLADGLAVRAALVRQPGLGPAGPAAGDMARRPVRLVVALDWLMLARTTALGFGYLPARGITMPADLAWLRPVFRNTVTPPGPPRTLLILLFLLRHPRRSTDTGAHEGPRDWLNHPWSWRAVLGEAGWGRGRRRACGRVSPQECQADCWVGSSGLRACSGSMPCRSSTPAAGSPRRAASRVPGPAWRRPPRRPLRDQAVPLGHQLLLALPRGRGPLEVLRVHGLVLGLPGQLDPGVVVPDARRGDDRPGACRSWLTSCRTWSRTRGTVTPRR